MQSKSNKQGSGESLPVQEAERFVAEQRQRNRQTFDAYNEWVEAGLAREIARIDLPLSTYSRLHW
jgi:thymidylate synthase (FAD)